MTMADTLRCEAFTRPRMGDPQQCRLMALYGRPFCGVHEQERTGIVALEREPSSIARCTFCPDLACASFGRAHGAAEPYPRVRLCLTCAKQLRRALLRVKL